MSNALFLYDNLLARYQFSLSFTGWGSTAGTIRNMADTPALAQRWVSPSLSAADTRFQFSVAGSPAVAAVVLAHHNLTLAAQVRVQASNDVAFGTTLYDSGWVNAFAAGMTEASRDGQLQHFWLQLPTATAAAYWRLQITDAANPDGYVAAGRLHLAASAFQPEVNMLAGASLAYEDRSTVEQADSGAEWFLNRRPRKVARFTLDGLSLEEGLGHAFTLQRLASSARRELLFVYDPADGVHSQRRMIFGRLRELNALEEPFATALRSAFEVSEFLP